MPTPVSTPAGRQRSRQTAVIRAQIDSNNHYNKKHDIIGNSISGLCSFEQCCMAGLLISVTLKATLKIAISDVLIYRGGVSRDVACPGHTSLNLELKNLV